jgi:hypothetical protein
VARAALFGPQLGSDGAIEIGDVDEISAQLAAPERVRQATEQQLTPSYL